MCCVWCRYFVITGFYWACSCNAFRFVISVNTVWVHYWVVFHCKNIHSLVGRLLSFQGFFIQPKTMFFYLGFCFFPNISSLASTWKWYFYLIWETWFYARDRNKETWALKFTPTYVDLFSTLNYLKQFLIPVFWPLSYDFWIVWFQQSWYYWDWMFSPVINLVFSKLGHCGLFHGQFHLCYLV